MVVKGFSRKRCESWTAFMRSRMPDNSRISEGSSVAGVFAVVVVDGGGGGGGEWECEDAGVSVLCGGWRLLEMLLPGCGKASCLAMCCRRGLKHARKRRMWMAMSEKAKRYESWSTLVL